MSYKFDEAALSNDNKKTFEKISLEKINEEIKKDETNIKNYKGIIFCPECNEPQLSIVNNSKTNDYFLRTYPRQNHSDICSYSFEDVDVDIFNAFLEEKNNTQFINSKLHNIIDRLLRNKFLDFNPLIVRLNDNKITAENISREEKNRYNVRRIPIKSITAPFSDDDYGVYKFFYGNVDIVIKERTNKTSNELFYSLIIYKKKTNTILCSLSVSRNVFIHLQRLYNLELDNKKEEIYIAFASKLTLNNQYKNGTIIHSDYCVIDMG